MLLCTFIADFNGLQRGELVTTAETSGKSARHDKRSCHQYNLRQRIDHSIRPCGRVVRTATSNTSGSYYLSLPEGEGYRLEFTLENYVSRIRQDISVKSNQEITVNAQLERDSGTVVGRVNNAVTNTGLGDVAISAYDVLGTLVNTTTTDGGGAFNMSLPAGVLYRFEFNLADYYPSVYSNILVGAGEEAILEAVLQIETSITGTGSVTGRITDAVSGNPVEGAMLRFRQGIHNTEGSFVAETTSDMGGNYSMLDTLSSGQYTAEISHAGYITDYITVLILGGQLLGNQNGTISPEPTPGEVRIVLSWGEFPRDLDSHLTGPLGDNSVERFHVYFAAKGSEISSPYTILDIDDTSSYGPETITIKSQFRGTYRYSVHDYSNRGAVNSVALANSGAKVVIYQSGSEPRTFNVPAGVGTLWTVFELNGAVITPVNTLSDETLSTNIRSLDVANDASTIRAMPDK